ncbi:MAG: dipicolinate synthase subunit B [Christensenellaceae bacterium]|nr:dipicolinate synthase subunit B [Christensenellaceae bacterium]
MIKLGYAVTGSFCTFSKTLVALQALIDKGYDITPVFSFNTLNLDTRFFRAKDFYSEVTRITGKYPIADIVGAEPLGTREKLDLMIVSPCTGNTLAKLAAGITDTPVTLAVKAHLRNNRPVLLALSSNDALGANAKNFGILLNTKNVFFVPMGQDAPDVKTKSLIADFSRIPEAVECALAGRQMQPVFCEFE